LTFSARSCCALLSSHDTSACGLDAFWILQWTGGRVDVDADVVVRGAHGGEGGGGRGGGI
jgi:hypothetical protein